MTTEERPASREEAVERVLDVLPRDLDVYEASRIATAIRTELEAAYEAGRKSVVDEALGSGIGVRSPDSVKGTLLKLRAGEQR